MLMLVMALLSQISWSTVTVSKIDCPVQFEGRVQEVIEPIGSSSAFQTQTVIFSNHQTLKGVVGEQVSVEVLKHGPVSVEQDKDYRVQLRAGRVCWIEQI